MDRSRRIAARVLVALGLVVASLSLSAWWAQAIISREFPVVTALALHSIEAAAAGQLQAQLGASGLTPAQRQAATNALDDPRVHQALTSGDPGAAVSSALVQADPALAPVLRRHPISLPPVGRTVTRDVDRFRPIAAGGLVLGAVLVGLALAVGTDRFRVARQVGWWGLLAGGLPLLAGRALPNALGLAHGHGAWGSLARTELTATAPLVALSLGLCAGGAVLVAVGTGGPYLVRWVLHGSTRAPAAPGTGAAVGGPLGERNAWSASQVDIRL